MNRGPEKEKTHRLFLGIPADAVAKQLLPQLPPAIFTGAFARENLKKTRPENWHLTLSFMPAVTADQTRALIAAVRDRAFGSEFAVTLSRLGAFQSWEHASVLFAAPSGDDFPGLQKLATEARSLVAGLHIAQDDKSFVPHLTLARCRRVTDLTAMTDQTDSIPGTPVILPVREIILYESTRTAGELYTHLTSALLHPIRNSN